MEDFFDFRELSGPKGSRDSCSSSGGSAFYSARGGVELAERGKVRRSLEMGSRGGGGLKMSQKSLKKS